MAFGAFGVGGGTTGTGRLVLSALRNEADSSQGPCFADALAYYSQVSASSGDSISFPFQEQTPSTNPRHIQAAQETWNWCARFVVPHNLCPWAPQSVQTNQAIRIYVCKDVNEMTESLRLVSQQFYGDLEQASSSTIDANAAIAFVILADSEWAFGDYYDWYVENEDDWLDAGEDEAEHLANAVTWAPFHPDYQFEGDEECLQFEKQSPYPTVSIVSSAVIDAAGPATTAQIAKNNEEILRGKSASQWRELYLASVRTPQSDSTTI